MSTVFLSALENEFGVECERVLSRNDRGTTVAAVHPRTLEQFVFRVSNAKSSSARSITHFCKTFSSCHEEFGLVPMSETRIIVINQRRYLCEIYEKIVCATGLTMDLADFVGSATSTEHRLAGLFYVQNVVDSVVKLHRAGFCHMDVSFENIVLSDKRAYLIDFESNMNVKVHEEGPDGLTRSCFIRKEDITVPIKLPYCPIEHFKSAKTDFVSVQGYDVWALGVMLFAVLFGNYPFSTTSSNRVNGEELKYFYKFGLEEFVEKYHPEAVDMIEECKGDDNALISQGWELLRSILVKPKKQKKRGAGTIWQDANRMSAVEISSHPMWNILM